MPNAGQRRRSPTPPRRGSPTQTSNKKKKKNDEDEYKPDMDTRSSSWRPHVVVPTYYVAPRGRKGHFASLNEAIAYAEPFSRIEVLTGNYTQDVIVTKPVEIVASPACEETPVFHSRGTTFTIQCQCYIEGLKISTADLTGDGVGMRIAVMDIEKDKGSGAGAVGAASLLMNRDDGETSVPKIYRCEIDCIDVCGKSMPIVEENKIIGSRRTGIQVLDEAGGTYKGNTVEEHDQNGLMVNTIGQCEFTHNKFSKSMSCQVVVHGRKTERDIRAGVTTRAVAPVFRYNRFCDDAPIRTDGPGKKGANNKSAAAAAASGAATSAQMMPLRTTDDLICLVPAHEKNRQVDMEAWEGIDNDEVLDRRCAVEVYNGAEPLFETNMFMQSIGMGIRVHTGGKGVIRYNRFSQNRTFAATFEGEDTSPLFLDNNVQDNFLGGVRVRDNASPRIEGNNFVENKGPQLIVMRGCAQMHVLYNLFITGSRVGAVLKANASGHFVGNTFRDTHIGIRLEGYSSPTFSSLLEGKKLSAQDRKTTQTDRDETNRFQQCYIGVAATKHAYGVFDAVEFSNSRACAVMILTDARTSFHKCNFMANDHSVLVQRSGRGTFTACKFRDNHLSTVMIKERGDPTFHDCQFLRGQEDAVVVSENGLGRFTRNFFSENENSHIVIKSTGDPEVHQNLMVSSGKAAVLVCEGGAGQITENLICANHGDGLQIESYSAPTVRNNVIRGNNGAGISVGANGDGIIEKNEFLDNRGANAVITGGKETGKKENADNNNNNNNNSNVGDENQDEQQQQQQQQDPSSPASPVKVSFEVEGEPGSPTTDAAMNAFQRAESLASAAGTGVAAGTAAALGRLHSKGFVVLRRNWFLRSSGGGVLCSSFGRCVLVENVFDQESSMGTSAVRIMSGGLVIAVSNRFSNGSGLFVGDDGHCVAMMNSFKAIEGPAIVLDTGSRPFIAYNTIEDCAVGIACSGGGGGVCFENVIVRSRLAAVTCERFSRTAVMGNVVVLGGSGIVAREKAKNRISANFFYGMRTALDVMGELDNFFFVNNLVYKCTESGITLRGGAAQIARCALISNPVGVLVDGDALRAGIQGHDFSRISPAGTCHHFGMATVRECFIALGLAIRVRAKGKARFEKTVINKCSKGIDVTDMCTPIFKDCAVSSCLLGASFSAHGGCEMMTCVLSRNVRNLVVTNKAAPLISRCLFSAADFFNITFDNNAGGTLIWCVVKQAVRGGGIYVGSGSTPTIQRCVVRAHTLTGAVTQGTNASTLHLHGGVTEKRAVSKSFVGRASVVNRPSGRRHESFNLLRERLEKSAAEENDLVAKSMITGATQAMMSSSRRGRAASIKPGAKAAVAVAAVAARRGRAGSDAGVNSPGDSDRKNISFAADTSVSFFEGGIGVIEAGLTSSRSNSPVAGADGSNNNNMSNIFEPLKDASSYSTLKEVQQQSSNSNYLTQEQSAIINADLESDEDDDLEIDESSFDAQGPVVSCLDTGDTEDGSDDPPRGNRSPISKAEQAERSRTKQEESFFFGQQSTTSAFDAGAGGGGMPKSFANIFADQREVSRRKSLFGGKRGGDEYDGIAKAERGGFRGSGLAVDEGGRPKVVKCLFSENNVGLIVRNNGDPHIEDCTFEDNLDHGVLLLARSAGKLLRCKMQSNRVYQCLASGETISTTLSGCTFGPNATEGLRCEFRAHPRVEECTFVGCSDAGLMATHSAAPLVERCGFDECCIGVIIVSAAGIYRGCNFAFLSHCGALVEEEIVAQPPHFEDNVFRGCNIVGLRVTSGSHATVIGNRIHGNGIGVEISEGAHAELQENRIYENEREGVVVSNESTAHIARNIFRANKVCELSIKLDSAPTVIENVFSEAENDGCVFVMSLGTLKCNKFIKCGGNAIVIRGASSINDNYYNTAARGDTPPGGRSGKQVLAVTGNLVKDNLGVGIVVSEAADAVLIEGNTIVGNGQGGIAIDTEAMPRITHNLLKLNRYRGIRVCNMSRPEIRGNMVSCTSPGSCIVVESGAVPTISSNVVLGAADGGIRFTHKARGTALGNLIAGCTGAGVLVEGKATPTLQSNMIFDCDIGVHWRDGGGGFLMEAYVTGIFNIAGFYIEKGCAPRLEDCTIHDLHRVPAIVDCGKAVADRMLLLGCAVGVEVRGGSSIYNDLHVADCVFGVQVYGGTPTFTNAVLCHNQRGGVVVEKTDEVILVPVAAVAAVVVNKKEDESPSPPAKKGLSTPEKEKTVSSPTSKKKSSSSNTLKPPAKRSRSKSIQPPDSTSSSSPKPPPAAPPQPPKKPPTPEDSDATSAADQQQQQLQFLKEYGGTFNKCKIYHSKQGVLVEGGNPTFDECDVYWHTDGFVLADGAPTVTRCNVYDNHNSGIWLKDGDGGVVRLNYGFDNGFATMLVDGGVFTAEENKLCFPKDGGALVLRGGGQGTGMSLTQLPPQNLAAVAKVVLRGNTERNKYDNPPFERSLADRKLSYQQYRHDVERHSAPFRKALRSFEAGCMQSVLTTMVEFGWWAYVAPPKLIGTPAGQQEEVLRQKKEDREAAERKKRKKEEAEADGRGGGGGGSSDGDGGETPSSTNNNLKPKDSFTETPSSFRQQQQQQSKTGAASPASNSKSPLDRTFGSMLNATVTSATTNASPGRDADLLLTEEEQEQKIWSDPELQFLHVPTTHHGTPPHYTIPAALQARADVAKQQQQQQQEKSAGRSSKGGDGDVDGGSGSPTMPRNPAGSGTSFSPGSHHNASVSEAVAEGNEVAGWFIADVIRRVEDLVKNAVSTSKAQAAAAYELLGQSPHGAAASMSPVARSLGSGFDVARSDDGGGGGGGDDDDYDIMSDMQLEPESPTGSRRNVGMSWGSNTHTMQRTKTNMAQVKTNFAASLTNAVAEVQDLAVDGLKEQLPEQLPTSPLTSPTTLRAQQPPDPLTKTMPGGNGPATSTTTPAAGPTTTTPRRPAGKPAAKSGRKSHR